MPVVDEDATVAALQPIQHVSELTGAKIRTFLFELAEGVSNYRSLHSLTEQVEHQYHGRFLIELIQNAHDALPETFEPGRPSRIAVVLDQADSKCGSLLVANDGHPFTSSNFERLSQLGQSDKDPQKSIGNKGLGFRSVLEVSERPEVYSRATENSASFDGYCFAFEPEVVQSLVAPMVALAKLEQVPLSPVSGRPIVDWSDTLLRKYRSRVRAAGDGWLRTETKYLSPYLLPVPRSEVRSNAVKALEAQGFATVIRLPLKSQVMNKLVQEHMAQLSSSTLLFLDRVSALELRVTGKQDRVFARSIERGDGPLAQRTIRIQDSAGESREYAVWTRELHIAEATEEFQAAVKALPGRWPEIQDVSVSIAVRLGDVREVGTFSIYLPTGIPTGSAVHINAPFFGNMSRTDISFGDGYNRRLLDTAASLAIEVVRLHLAGKAEREAQQIVDIVAPFGTDSLARSKWSQMIDDAFERVSGSLDEEHLILAETGWRPLNATSLVPDTSKATLLTETVLRKHATFDIFHTCLSSRRDQLIDLAKSRYGPVGAYPLSSDVAETVASAAQELHASGGDWNAFWGDVLVLLPDGQKELAKHKVILGNDGQLHDAGDKGRVFFVPRQGTLDDSDIGGDGATIEVPASLQSMVAFLSDEITVYEPGRPTQQTLVRSYLANGLVTPFRVETIFTSTLKEATPKLPAPLKGPDAERCLDILRWSLGMIRSAVARDRGSDAMLSLLRPIPVPCIGGWFPMAQASFGAGWPETAGDILATYLGQLSASVSKRARERVLLAPNQPEWYGIGAIAQDLLFKGGVFDGLRLDTIKSESWLSGFSASLSSFKLPQTAPPGLNPEFWADYKRQVEGTTSVHFVTPQHYVVGAIHVFPGMADPRLPDEARGSLSQLILRSLPKWANGLDDQTFTKHAGYRDIKRAISPLKHFLQTWPWLAVPSGKTAWARPLDRWHVPSDVVARRATHFSHLRALPYELARLLDSNVTLADRMHQLGMPYLDLHAETDSPKLLQELIAAIESEDAPESNVLLGQIREAWHRFRPLPGQARLPRLPVRNEDRQLAAVDLADDVAVYLPDLGTLASELEQFGARVLTIYPEDARTLKDWFAAAYGPRVVPTSQLRLIPRAGGEPWHGGSAVPLPESELAWLVAPVLTLVAFYQQIRGIHSQAFQDRLVLLREMRVDWVPSAEVVVMGGDTEVMRTSVLAHWEPSRKTLLLPEACRSEPAALSTVLAQALDRDDLELPLRIILGGLKSIDEPPDGLGSALSTLRVSDEQLKLVQQHLRGDVGHAARLIQVLCGVIAPESDTAELMAAESEDQLVLAITATGIAGINVQDLLRIAGESRDLFDFGSAIARALGERVELPHWNAVLEQLNRPPLVNLDWRQQLRGNLEEALGIAKRVIAHIVRQDGSTGSFKAMLSEYEHLPPDGLDLSMAYWEVDFRASMSVVADLVATWQGSTSICDALRASAAARELRERLVALGVDMESDPDERCRVNYQLIGTVANSLERLLQAWWVKSDAAARYGGWRTVRDDYVTAAKEALGNGVFTETLTESCVFAVLRQSSLHAHLPGFQKAMASSTDLASLRVALAIEEEDIADIDGLLAAQRAEAQRRRHLVQVCGDEFDAAEDNRNQLWQFLKARIKFEELAAARPVDLSKATGLMPMPPGRGRDTPRGDRPKATKTPQRQPKAVDELIGLAGEIFVFEMLQRQYGSDAVTSSSWVSSNSRYVFEDNAVDDGAGCDFAFTAGGRSYKVEVKATSGEEQSFNLGSSEIALAVEIATKKRARRERFVLIHVMKVLSPEPEAVVLPNPYDAKSSGIFRIDRADARVEYRLKN